MATSGNRADRVIGLMFISGTDTSSLVGADAALADDLARVLRDRFVAFHREFIEVSGRARQRFLDRDWAGQQRDAGERLKLHTAEVLRTVEICLSILAPGESDVTGCLEYGGFLWRGESFENRGLLPTQQTARILRMWLPWSAWTMRRTS